MKPVTFLFTLSPCSFLQSIWSSFKGTSIYYYVSSTSNCNGKILCSLVCSVFIELWIWRNLRRSSHCLFWSTIPDFFRRNWGKPWKLLGWSDSNRLPYTWESYCVILQIYCLEWRWVTRFTFRLLLPRTHRTMPSLVVERRIPGVPFQTEASLKSFFV